MNPVLGFCRFSNGGSDYALVEPTTTGDVMPFMVCPQVFFTILGEFSIPDGCFSPRYDCAQ
ncbi:hypothetical protein JCM17961_41600 [Endothiovibrio diazotrophicus]